MVLEYHPCYHDFSSYTAPLPISLIDTTTEGILFARLSTFDGRVRNSNVIGRCEAVPNVARCASLCLNTPRCDSFFVVGNASTGSSLMCQKHSLVFTSVSGSEESPGSSYWHFTLDECPHDKQFIAHRPLGLCYRVVVTNVTMNWYEADDTCRELGYHLLDLPTKEHWVYLLAVLESLAHTDPLNLFMGGTLTTSGWQWSDGQAFSWTQWRHDEPNGFPVERCLVLLEDFDFYWADTPCYANMASAIICEKEMVSG